MFGQQDKELQLNAAGHARDLCRAAAAVSPPFFGKQKQTYRYLSVLDERLGDLALVEIEQLLDLRARAILLTADAIWVLISVASIFVLVPLTSRVAEGAADWQRIHRIWDRRHRVRIAALATAAVLLTYVVVR